MEQEIAVRVNGLVFERAGMETRAPWSGRTLPGDDRLHMAACAADFRKQLSAVAHGKIRRLQGYSPAMLVHDSRILQVTLFGTLQKNLNALDFSLLLPDVMTIADEVDSQLTQAIESYMGVVGSAAAA